MRIILKEEATRTVAVVELKLVKKPEAPAQSANTNPEASGAAVDAQKGPDPMAVLRNVQDRGLKQTGPLDSIHAAGAEMMKALIEGLRK